MESIEISISSIRSHSGIILATDTSCIAKTAIYYTAEFPSDIFPLVPMTFYTQRINIKSYTNLSVSIKQFPINISVSGTLWKFQSLKVDHLLLDELRLGEHPYVPPPESLYVAVSRATLLKNLYLIKLLTNEDWAYFQPSPFVLRELARLEDVAIDTKKRLHLYLQDTSPSSAAKKITLSKELSCKSRQTAANSFL